MKLEKVQQQKLWVHERPVSISMRISLEQDTFMKQNDISLTKLMNEALMLLGFKVKQKPKYIKFEGKR